MNQQDYLRYVMIQLGLTRSQFSERIGASRRALDSWLLPSESKEFRSMPEMAWKFIREIMENRNQQSNDT